MIYKQARDRMMWMVSAIAIVFAGCNPETIDQPGEPDTIVEEDSTAYQVARRPYTAANGDVSIYFTRPGVLRGEEEDPEVDDELAAAIMNAETSIDLCLYEFNRQIVVDAVLDAAARGVQVRFAGDGDEYHDEGYVALMDAGVQLAMRKPRDRIMHNKFIIIDNKTVFTGSMNISNNGTTLNNNHVIKFENPAMARIYTEEFEQMYMLEKFGRKKEVVALERGIPVGGTMADVYFSPGDEIDERVLDELAKADHRVYYMIFSFTHEAIAAELATLHDLGVEVVGVFDESQARGRYSADEKLAQAQVPTFIDGNKNSRGFAGGKLHHKVMLIDAGTDSEPTVIIGSYNWSNAASKYNDENVVILRGEEFVAPFVEEWCKVYEVATPHPDYFDEIPDPCANLLAPIRINEFMANPDGSDTDNEWIELVNPGSASVSLEGWTIGDRVKPTGRHTFGDVKIPPGGSLVIYSGASDDEPWREIASSGTLALTNNQDDIILSDAGGVVIDKISYSRARSGVSFNRNPDGGADGDFVLHTDLGMLNESPDTMADGTPFVGNPRVVINELLPNPVGTDKPAEFVEIVNIGPSTANLDGWVIQDATGSVRHEFVGTQIAPGQAIVIFGENPPTGALASSTGNLSLNNSTETISLIDDRARLHDQVVYASSSEGKSLNRETEADPEAIMVNHDTVAGAVGGASPGKRVSGGLWALDTYSRISINEFFPNPDGSDTGKEFVELVNTGTEPVDLDGWELWDAIAMRHTFTSSRILQPGEHVVIFDSGNHGSTPKWVKSSTNSLSLNNSGDVITLKDSIGDIHDAITYSSSSSGKSWNRAADGTAGAEFVTHDDVIGAVGGSSPGKRADGGAWE